MNSKTRVTIIFGTSLSAIFLLSSGIFVVAGATSLPTFAPAFNLSNDGFRATDSNVQNSGSNVYVVWTEGPHGIYFRASSDDGTTWNPPTSSSALKISSSRGNTNAPLMTDSGNYVYIVWPQSSQIYFAVSTNNGASFSAPLVVSTSGVTSLTPVIAAYGSDVYVAYDGGGHSYVTASSNNGATWTKPFLYGSGPEPQVAAWRTNAYAIADSSSRATTAITVTHNNGVSWTKTGSSGGSEPWIAAQGTNVIAAWETKGSTSKVYSHHKYKLWHHIHKAVLVILDCT